MTSTKPPPLPANKLSRQIRRRRPLVFLIIVFATPLVLLTVSHWVGLLRSFSVPTGGMAPAISPGDHVMMERFSYLGRKPRRGDVVVFKTDGLPSVPPSELYVKRVAGEPGDNLRIAEGKLYINGKHVTLSNAFGEIACHFPAAVGVMVTHTDLTVPPGHYFVLGDNSTNSNDSRFWGCLPGESIVGRVVFCYWPVGRIGRVR